MKIHLGCGSNYINGWVNIDIDSPVADVHYDLRNPLPYESATVDYIFNEHFIEHVTRQEGVIFLKECRRILKPGGIFRVSTPDLKFLATQYLAGNLNEWADVGWVSETPCRLLNEGMRWWGHQFLYDAKELRHTLQEAGFMNVTEVEYHQSTHTMLMNLESRPWHQELMMEAF